MKRKMKKLNRLLEPIDVYREVAMVHAENILNDFVPCKVGWKCKHK